jgi:hypothetical protein
MNSIFQKCKNNINIQASRREPQAGMPPVSAANLEELFSKRVFLGSPTRQKGVQAGVYAEISIP